MVQLTQSGGSYANSDVIVPDDNKDLRAYDALWVGTAGTVVIMQVNGEIRSFVGVQGYLFHRVKRVLTTTSATDILGLY